MKGNEVGRKMKMRGKGRVQRGNGCRTPLTEELNGANWKADQLLHFAAAAPSPIRIRLQNLS
ncbi:hypothetical protein SLEP1_g33809 [Rubroshorea leprosula]|uniref:Uncharacterized protein n=1 Tax=Rubroshorea leprosula TaxID=152421 RepID=A0AAV5KHS9_9ROSI|nr:hypothetical protein SLEP1_g33809 [Rubroshorea leprosula]